MQIYEGTENYIFISYSHKDSATVMPIVQGLANANFRVWYDAGIEAGSEWPENVATHIAKSNVVLIFLSKNALDSHNCVREIHFAIKKRKKILVIYLEELELSDGMDMQLSPLQAMFLYRYKSIDDFIKNLTTAKILAPCRINGSEDSQAPTPIINTEPPKKKTTTPKATPTKKKTPAKNRTSSNLLPPIVIKPQDVQVENSYKIPVDLLNCKHPVSTVSKNEIESTKKTILAALAAFKITDATIPSVHRGPTITRYPIKPFIHIPQGKVPAFEQTLNLALSTSGISFHYDSAEGGFCVDIPNKKRTIVPLGSMLNKPEFLSAKPNSLTFALGKSATNKRVYGYLDKMAHILVTGKVGSGKSVFLHSLITSLIYQHSPAELGLILIDPKEAEFSCYEGLPHLLVNEIISEKGKVLQSLNWAIQEMNRRYSLFEVMSRAGNHVVNLDQYNEQVNATQRLPKIVIVIDEFSRLMIDMPHDMEMRIQALTQKARATGIHLVLATQYATTNVITSVIKANFPTRIAFCTVNDASSRIILDESGAQNLLGNGDFVYLAPGVLYLTRMQGTYIERNEIQGIVSYIKDNYNASYNNLPENTAGPELIFIEALRVVVLNNSASISLIQRKCQLGYNRAGQIIEWMEDMGYVSPFDGAKARTVLITKEEFEDKYGPL